MNRQYIQAHCPFCEMTTKNEVQRSVDGHGTERTYQVCETCYISNVISETPREQREPVGSIYFSDAARRYEATGR